MKSTPGYPTQIFDAAHNHIADVEVRSWGRLQYMEEGDKMHAQLSAFIQDAINEKLARMESFDLSEYVSERSNLAYAAASK
ncbi:hypothetical protein [Neolewinella maritima]|uniref:hypothetical protein n=1 Tax=Neolewinella maritima TaxID=1383882 RepID=UPI001EE899F8|nr:hypothetical protein [Neolewinella maritima]